MARRPSGQRTSNRRKSECIASSHYDAQTETLDITFQQRGSHTYTGVPQAVADGLKRSASPGVFFNAVIRSGY